MSASSNTDKDIDMTTHSSSTQKNTDKDTELKDQNINPSSSQSSNNNTSTQNDPKDTSSSSNKNTTNKSDNDNGIQSDSKTDESDIKSDSISNDSSNTQKSMTSIQSTESQENKQTNNTEPIESKNETETEIQIKQKVDPSKFEKLTEIIDKLNELKNTGNLHFQKKVYHLAVTDYDKAIDFVYKDMQYKEMQEYLESSKTAEKTHTKQLKSKTKIHHLRESLNYNNENIKKLNNIIGAIYNNRAFCYFRLELYGASVDDSTNAVKLKFWKGYYRRGCSNAAQGKWSKAKKDFEKAQKKFPKNKDIKNKLKQATSAFREEKFYAAISVEKGKPAYETAKITDFEDIPDDYKGPRLPSDLSTLTQEWIINLLEYQKKEKIVHIRVVYELIMHCIREFEKYKNVEYYEHNNSDNITVCGDVHGQYWDYLNIFKLNGYPSNLNPYLFNGDFVDRGSWSCEIIISMLGFRLLYPNNFLMTRGNHETISMNAMYGFQGEVEHKYNKCIFNLFTELFNFLPIAYILGNKVFVCHGGLFKEENVLINDLQKIERNNQPNQSGSEIMQDCLWSDPQDFNGLAPSKRGGGTMFGPDITSKFLKDNNLELLIRSHEVQEEGYKIAHNGKCITIFSAPNYIDQMGNKGAFIKLDKNYKPHFTQFDAVPHPDKKPMAYARGPLGFRNFM